MASLIKFPVERTRPPIGLTPMQKELEQLGTLLFKRINGRSPGTGEERANARGFSLSIYSIFRSRHRIQVLDELIGTHLGVVGVELFKGVEARFGLPWEQLCEAQAQEALKWGAQAERGALALRQFLKELEGRFVESLSKQLMPPEARRSHVPSAKNRIVDGSAQIRKSKKSAAVQRFERVWNLFCNLLPSAAPAIVADLRDRALLATGIVQGEDVANDQATRATEVIDRLNCEIADYRRARYEVIDAFVRSVSRGSTVCGDRSKIAKRHVLASGLESWRASSSLMIGLLEEA